MDNKDHKIYLNTVEEILDALSEGEAVYEDISGGNIKYKMYNGAIISEWCNGTKFINAGSIVEENNRYYMYGKKPLKIEVGKFYKTREGKKVICAYKSKAKEDYRPYFFSSVGGDEIFSMWTTKEGYVSKSEEQEFRDVVDYWEE